MGARSAHILLFGRPGGQRMHAFWNAVSELDFGGVLGARSGHILLFGRPGDQRMHVFWKSASEPDLFV